MKASFVPSPPALSTHDHAPVLSSASGVGCPRLATGRGLALAVGALAILVLVSSCRGVPAPEQLVKSAELTGEIRPWRSTVAVGDSLVVDYLLRNVSARRLVFDVEDPAKDPALPFHGYGFNARSKSDRVALTLSFLGAPLVGHATIEPGASTRFQRATWVAERPGVYVLSFSLEWRAGQLVQFEEVEVTVTGEGPAQLREPGVGSDSGSSQAPEK